MPTLGPVLNPNFSGRTKVAKLEPLVWEGVVNILLNPKSLREGYEQTIEREQQKQARRIQHIETLQAAIEKLYAKRGRLQKCTLIRILE